MTRGLGAVLFDMDGTLLDSEKLWTLALADVANWRGGELSERARHRMVGSSLARSIAILHDDLGIAADPEGSAAYLVERTAELFATDLTWKPGAGALLAAVQAAGLPAALVTSTHRRLTDIALDMIGRQFFAATVCGDEVAHPKPAAEPYRLAASLVGIDPAQCVAVEDSPLGVASAEAAGCTVLAVPSEVPIERGSARTVVASLDGVTVADLAALLDRDAKVG